VRIRGDHGAVLGAGVVLGDRHVLTCAHVVAEGGGPDGAAGPDGLDGALVPGGPDGDLVPAGPPGPVTVEAVGLPGAPPAGPATVVPGCWVPPGADERGDLALLVLAQPLPESSGAPLRRLALTRGRPVDLYGFPSGVDTGLWVEATLQGPGGPGDEWVQMTGAERLRRGFSGAAVCERATGYVLGVVVSTHTDRYEPSAPGGPYHSWMIPVETVVRYLPAVLTWVSGESTVDASFTTRTGRVRPADEAVARAIMRFLRGRSPGATMIVVTPDDGSPQLDALRQVVVLGSRELRPVAPGRFGPPPAPGGPALPVAPDAGDPPAPPDGPLPAVDLALDVSGRSTAEVARRILDWLGTPGDAPVDLAAGLTAYAPAMNVVLDGVDRAVDPPALLEQVVRPLVGQGNPQGVRLLLSFRQPPPGELWPAPSAGTGPVLTLDDAASTERQLQALAERVAEAAVAERATGRLQARVAARIAGVRQRPLRTPQLRLRLAEMYRAADDPGLVPLLPDRIAACQAAVERALAAARRHQEYLEKLLDTRQELRGLVEAHHARSAAHGLAEDPALAVLHREACAAL